MGDLISQILNSRKPKVTDTYIEEMQGNNKDSETGIKYTLTNLAFEIKNKDSNGRAILHRAAFDHKNDEMEQILREYTKRPGILDVNEVDWYGNTALILACINKPEDEVDK
jgi:ankyrin repeat protein